LHQGVWLWTQTPTIQAGYLQKNKGKEWYEWTAKGITQEQLDHAVNEYDKKKTGILGR
jgi:hypothetical protein